MIAALYFGSEPRSFKSRDEAAESVKCDAADIAAERGGEVVDYGNGEWVVNSRSGEEIARWEVL